MSLRVSYVLLILALMPFSASAQEKVKLALNWKAEPQFGGFYAARSNGHFTKNGFDVDILQGGAGTPSVQMVAAGQVDFAIVSADEVVISRARGGTVVAVFAAYQTNPQGIMVHEESGFDSLKDVFQSTGTLALQKGLPYAMYLSKKFSPTSAKIVPYLGGVANFLSDQKYSQQCFVTSEPLAAKKKGARVRSFLIADEGFNPYTTVLATRDEILNRDPKRVKAMVDAVRAGWKDYLEKPEPTNRLMHGLNKSMDQATFAESAEAQKPLIETAATKKDGLGVMSAERWKTLADQLVNLGVVKSAPQTEQLFRNL